MAVDNLIIRDLPRLSWMGLPTPPYDVVTGDIRNELAPRRIPYVDGAVHDPTGREPYAMTARLLFVNSLFNTTGVRLFPELWEQWRITFDGGPGDFTHPILGRMRARVEAAKPVLDAKMTGGIIVDVTWVETVEDPSLPSYLEVLQLDPGTLATKADAAAALYGVSVPDGFPYGGLSDAVSEVRGLSFSLDPTVVAILDTILVAAALMIDLLDIGRYPARIAAYDILLAFWDSIRLMKSRIRSAGRPTAREVLRNDTTLDQFARAHGNEMFEVMALNPGAIRSPVVRRGTTLTYYAAA
ncbi:MAG: hypothetical protein E6R03_02600 [Hyphomicrobiaceae bacterium]|nr:MAG: hypothetical protein E6R03_02600 [Hyphomicrobiaceae bacterium]